MYVSTYVRMYVCMQGRTQPICCGFQIYSRAQSVVGGSVGTLLPLPRHFLKPRRHIMVHSGEFEN